MNLFSISHRKMNRVRAHNNIEQYSFLYNFAATQIIERLDYLTRKFEHTALIGRMSEKLKHSLTEKNLNPHIIQIDNDIDYVDLEENSYDLILSILDLHSINDLPGVLAQIKRALRPDGVFMCALMGGETLFELRECLMNAEMELYSGASPRVFPCADKPQIGGLLQRANFTLPVVDSEILHVSYRDIFHLMRDIKGMGESNIIRDRRKHFTPRRFFERANDIYFENFRDSQDETRITASFEIIFMIGWAAHETQQQPLRRGSATARLADVLQTKEEKL